MCWQSLPQSLPFLASGRPMAAACRGTTSSATGSSTMSRNRHSWALDARFGGVSARFGGVSAASRRMRAPRPWMNPLSKPPLWTRTVHVGHIPLPPAWRPGTVASHCKKLAAPLVGAAVLSSSVGDILIVPMAVAFALWLRVIAGVPLLGLNSLVGLTGPGSDVWVDVVTR